MSYNPNNSGSGGYNPNYQNNQFNNNQGYNNQQQQQFNQSSTTSGGGSYNPNYNQTSQMKSTSGGYNQNSTSGGSYNPNYNQQQQFSKKNSFGSSSTTGGSYNPNYNSSSSMSYNKNVSGYNPNYKQTYNQQQQSYGSSGGYNQQYNQQSYGSSGGYNQQYNQMQNKQNQQLIGWFKGVDIDGSGKIDSKELQKALSFSGMKFSEECALLLIKMFDTNKSGEIDFGEFSKLYKYLAKMKGAFNMVDSDRSGSLDMNEVYKAITNGGYKLSINSYKTVFAKFDRKKKGSLDFDGYIELCVFLGTVKKAFLWKDVKRQGVISFNFDSLVEFQTYLYP